MRHVTKIDICNFSSKDFESLMCRKFLLKSPDVCMFRIEAPFDMRNTLPFKLLIKFLRDRGRIVCLDIRNLISKEAVMSILPYLDSIKIKFEDIKDKVSLSEVLLMTERLRIPVILYIKAEQMSEFLSLYSTYSGDHINITRVIDVSYIDPERMVDYLDDRTYFLDCPLCFLTKHNLKSCTSGILDIGSVVRKVGRKIVYEDYERRKEPFENIETCAKCDNNFNCIGRDKKTVEHVCTRRTLGRYMSAYEVFRQTVERMKGH